MNSGIVPLSTIIALIYKDGAPNELPLPPGKEAYRKAQGLPPLPE